MIIGAIILGILICISVILSFYIRKISNEDFDFGVIIGCIMTILMVIEIYFLSNIIGKPTPSALDVYRGNTELEITSVNGVPTDSVVVFKEK